jgi:hypothetical protein
VSVLILLISFAALVIMERLTRPPGERLPLFVRRRLAIEPLIR